MTTAPAKPVAAPAPGFLQKLEAGFQKNEAWVVAELNKGWQLLQTAGHTAGVDLHAVTGWVQQHQLQLQAVQAAALEGLALVAPGLAPVVSAAVPVATAAIDAATKNIDALTAGIAAGSVHLSTVADTYHSVKAAGVAVAAVATAATSRPRPAHAAPPSAVHVTSTASPVATVVTPDPTMVAAAKDVVKGG